MFYTLEPHPDNPAVYILGLSAEIGNREEEDHIGLITERTDPSLVYATTASGPVHIDLIISLAQGATMISTVIPEIPIVLWKDQPPGPDEVDEEAHAA